MANQNLELALRIRTDLKNAAKQLDQFEKELDGISVAAAEADANLDKVTVPRKADSGGQLEQLEKDLENVSEAASNAGAALDKTSAVKDTGTAKQLDQIEKELLDVTDAAAKASAGIQQVTASNQKVTASNQTSATTKNTAAVKANNNAMRDGAISAGQYKQAMRQLPAQITDITTSLASGMPVWLVAIQQGGQIKDSFGGTREAAKALASTIKPIPLLLGSLAAATATVVLAHEQGAAESRRYTEALTLSGNAAGTNSDQLAEMAKRLDGVVGTRRAASAALTEIASAGKFTEAQMEQVARTALKMQDATGKAIGATVDEFTQLAADPVGAIEKLSEKYNHLDAAVYSNIAALQAQGREMEAVQLAFDTHANELESRADELAENIGLLERGWKLVKEAASESWDAMLDVGREDTLEDELDQVNERIQRQQEILRGRRRGETSTSLSELKAERTRLQLRIQFRDAISAEQAERGKLNKEAIAAMKEVDRLAASNLTSEEKRVAAIKEYQKQLDKIRQANPNDARLNDDTIANNIAGINARYADKKSTDRESKSLESFVAQLERQAEVLGKSASETRAYNIAEKGLSGELLARAQAANAAITAQEKLNQATADAKQLATIENRLLSLQGRTAEARSNDLENQYADLLLSLQARSDTAGIELVNSLINVEKAQAQLDELQAQVARVLSEQNRQEQTIRAQQESGLITELSAREQLLQLHRDTAEQVDRLIPQMEALAEASGNPDAIERVRQLKAEVEQLDSVTNEYGTTIKDALEDSLTEGFQDLASGAASLGDVLKDVIASIADALAQMAAQKASAQAATAAMTVLGYADGGYTGAGTKYQVKGVVHAGEYVQPAEVMREPGAMAFMENFRREGMRSLERFRGYAEGGPVGLSAVNYNSPAQALAASMPEMTVRQRLLPVLDKDLISDALRGPEGEQLIELHIKRNPGKFRQMLGG
ncbi:phage tail length tape measure family protein [Microbulbifer sp. OS29]|uniref:Phage tail length tape measure family protein n=1 Tax=Microbulbifer okhotskensis TaxID=2926617 RepID=A0A9X2ERZ8_9GAMM|nr:phage tail length tape measure family protein [Microbulbifer okhotskensis]MCO1336716.1 phage tail length tape measure family protein [Microbulbifer okhotskensis]